MKRAATKIVKYKFHRLDAREGPRTVTVHCPSGGHGAGHADPETGKGEHRNSDLCEYTDCGHNEGFVCERCHKRWCWCYGAAGCCDLPCDGCWVEIHKRGRVCIKRDRQTGQSIGPGLQYGPDVECLNAR